MTNEIKAPFPANFADLGFESCHTIKSIRPTIGIKNPKTPQPIFPSSKDAGCCSCLGLSFAEILVRAHPQFTQNAALGPVSFPQFGQYEFPVPLAKPHFIHTAAFSFISFPQFLQNMFIPSFLLFSVIISN